MIHLDALRNRDLRRVFAAQLLSQLGDKLVLVGVMWFLAARFAPYWAAIFAAVTALPHLLLAGSSPRLIHRLGGPLRTVIMTDVARAALFVGAAAAAAWASEPSPGVALAALLGLGLATNVGAALFNPAVMTLPGQLAVRDGRPADANLIGQATALVESCFSFSAVVAPALATAFYATAGLSGLLVINGLSYAVAAAIESRISRRDPFASSSAPLSPPSESLRPLAVLRRDPATAALLAGFLAFNLASGPVLVFIPLYASQIYGGSISSLAALETALGGGTLLGAVLLALVRLPGSMRARIPVALAGIGVSYLVFTLSTSLVTGTLAIAVLGTLLSVANVTVLGSLQDRPDVDEIPAIMSCVNLISVASLPVSMTLAGTLLAYAPLRGVAVGFALAATAVAAALALAGRLAPAPAAILARPEASL